MEKNKPQCRWNGPKRKAAWGLLLIGVVLAVSALSIPGVNAKYTRQSSSSRIAKAPEFYFTSDYLTVEGAHYTINPGENGLGSVSFEIRNYDGPKVSELDIHYEISVQSSGTDSVTGARGLLQVETENKETITLTDLVPGNSYTVTALGRNGYEAILRATFEVAAEPKGLHKSTADFGDYVLLTVWAENASGTVTITVPAGLIPDATDDALAAVTAGGTINWTLKAYESRSFRFFTTGTYNGDPIKVKSGNAVLDETPLN